MPLRDQYRPAIQKVTAPSAMTASAVTQAVARKVKKSGQETVTPPRWAVRRRAKRGAPLSGASTDRPQGGGTRSTAPAASVVGMTTLLTPPVQAVTPSAGSERPWVRRRPAVLALLAVTALLYLWTLSESGYANSFYSAAAQAGSQSWKAFFFGSLDAGSSITVDKPPAALWLMG